MPLRPEDLVTGGALQGAVAASLVQQCDAEAGLLPGSLVGAFRIVRELGRGGMAFVYLAERADGEYRQQVALKWMLQAQPDADGAELFRRELQALADLRHPQIARLLDGGRTPEGRPWFAMEYIEGEPIDRHGEHAGLAPRLRLFLQVCAAVASAHARGVIHRDIKPSNVLVDADGGAKLLDFGIARLLGQDDALAAHAGTPGYASPEQQRGETPTVASDVFQLGKLLDAVLGPAARGADLDAIVSKATQLDAACRYATAEALADDLQRYLARRPVAARGPDRLHAARLFVARHRFGSALAAVALATLIATTAAFTWRLAQERDLARSEAERAEAGEAFLVSLFRVSDPGVNRGQALTARELIDRGADRLQADTRYPPAVRARLLGVLAEVNFNLGEFAPTHALLDRALQDATDVRQRHALQAQRLWLLQREGRTADAVAAAPALLAGVPAGREWDAERARLHNAAARAAAQIGDARAAEWQARALAAAQRSGDELEQGHALRTAGFLRELDGDLPGALDATSRAVGKLRAALGPTSPDVFSARTHRAYLLRENARYDEALAEARALQRDAAAVIPPDHLARIYVDAALASVLLGAGRVEESLAVGDEVTARCERVLGVAHLTCGSALIGLVDALLALDRPADALPHARRLLDSRSATMGADHVYTVFARQRLAQIECRLGRVEAGRAMHRAVVARFAEEFPPGNKDRTDADRLLAQCGEAITPVPAAPR